VDWIGPYTPQFDKDHSGHIEMVEVVTAMEAVGRKVHLADFMRVLGVVDGNMDQKISFAEFVNLFETAKLKKEMLAKAGGFFKTGTRPTLNLLLLLRASV